MSTFTKEMEEENKMVLDEFEIIDKNCDMVNNIPNISSVVPMTHCLDDFEVELREDVAEESDSVEDLLSNCDQVCDREVELPKVVG